MPTVNRPAKDARVWHIDIDPLKERFELWDIGAERAFGASCATALTQLNRHLKTVAVDGERIRERREHYAKAHDAHARELARREQNDGTRMTPEFITARVREHISRDAIVLNESITNYSAVMNHIGARAAGTMFTSGGGSLGWHGGAAIGFKLARPEAEVVAITGDGSCLFSQPSSVQWMARRYATPFLQVVLNNGGWRAPKLSALTIHPDGSVSRTKDIGVTFADPPDYAEIAAAAGGAFARKVNRPDELDAALEAGLRAVRGEKRCAVLDVRLPDF